MLPSVALGFDIPISGTGSARECQSEGQSHRHALEIPIKSSWQSPRA